MSHTPIECARLTVCVRSEPPSHYAASGKKCYMLMQRWSTDASQSASIALAEKHCGGTQVSSLGALGQNKAGAL